MRPCCFALSLSVLGTLPAQAGPPSVLQLTGSYHMGECSTEIPNPSSPGTRSVAAARGTIDTRANLTFSGRITTRDIFAVSSNNRTVVDTPSGTYRVAADGRLVLDLDPSKPGTDLQRMFINADGTVIVGAREEADTESYLALLLRRSTGRSVASLNGRYALVSTFMEFTRAGLESGTAKGVITMDGRGKWTFTGSEQSVAANGTANISAVSDSGTYTVAADGAFSLGAGADGGISPNGEVFFFVDQATDEVGLTVAVKIGSQTAAQVAGTWAFGYHELSLGLQRDRPSAYTESATVELVATSGSGGTFAGESIEVESDPTGVSRGISKIAGLFSVLAGGVIRINPASSTPVDLNMVSSGDFYISTSFQGQTDLMIGLRICGDSGPYGTGTKGAGGIAPTQGMTTFPTVGNGAFRFHVVDGVGGGSGMLAIALAPSPGIPFLGGNLLVDPNLLGLLVPLALSGTKGAPGAGSWSTPVPIPALPALAGVSIYLQSVINDPAGPSGVTLTEGFRIRVCQ